MADTDYELLQGCRKGDARAWQAVLDRYERLVFSVALNYGLTRDDAADITQLTFTIFMQSMDDLEDDSRLGAWLATVAKRHTWRLLKRRRREQVDPEEDLADDPTLQATPIQPRHMERMAQLEWINQGFNLISERCRELLQMLYFDEEEPSYEEVAAALDMAVGSIGPTRARCLQRMKSALEAME